MNTLYYCVDCRRIFDLSHECTYCKSENIKELTKNAPVNVIGSKLKGNVFKMNQDTVSLRLLDVKNTPYIKEFNASQIRKIL